MIQVLGQWLPAVLFLLLFIGVLCAEVLWLTRKGWATSSLSTGYVLVADLVGFALGGFVMFVAFFIMFMMVMGPAGRGSDVPEWAYVVTSVIALIISLGLFVLSKRTFLAIFKIRSGKTAWIYSLVSSILILVVVFIPPSLAFLLFGYLSTWK